ncbi:MAG: uracil-DNA glycosylase [Wolbachia endosymbiont of Menacanthus eurysternus]|nr:MAG: uracil-DNA glycosylase [Wolbachia endosymbiont of Menacanthus eurysternus]
MNNKDLELLKFYHEMGIDSVLIEDKEEKKNKKSIDIQTINTEKKLDYTTYLSEIKDKKQQVISNDWIIEAKKLASRCNSIDELKNVILSFNGCEIKKTATNTIFSDGNPNAKIMLIGEAPGINEDLQGIPFCGVSGMLLDKMLNAINLDRTKVYISNTVFWRPPGNRKPTNFELDVCKPFVEKHIALISPQILILVGGIACYSLLDKTKTISSLRGKFYTYNNQYLSRSITTAIIFHPSYLLRQPSQKRLAWEDLKKIRDYILCHDIIV